jgi:putative aminopeptidase FrvX
MIRAALLLLMAVLPVCAQTLKFAPVSEDVIEQRLHAYVSKNDGREPAVRKLFEDAGCASEAITEQPVKGLKAPNIVCTRAGNALEPTILVGAHFDLVEKGDGVVDNWSGASLLASLYQGLSNEARRHTFRFVAFSGEERGLVGSKAYVKRLGTTHEEVAAMVNLDTLGLSETEVWLSHADLNLAKMLGETAATLKLPVSAVNVDGIGTSDSEPFRLRRIPSITIHSLTSETLPLLHGPKDRIGAIHMDEYYRTYRLVLAYLALLDQRIQ